MASQNQGGGGRPRPAKRTSTKIPSPLLRKARMIAVSRDVPLEQYVEAILRPAIESDFEQMFADAIDS